MIDAYVEAAANEDTETIAELTHSSNPFDPAQMEEEGWEFQGGGEAGDYDAEVVTEDGSIEDVLELEGAEFWFSEDHLEDEIGGEEIATVELESADDPATAVWVLVTEDDEWRVFYIGEVDDTPDDPREVFEAEIIDEDDTVVEEVDWEFEQENGFSDDVEWARVRLTDDPGLEAERVVVESTIEGSEFELFGEEPNSWTGSYVNVSFHAEGDQIVVTAVDDGEETVVHREHYLP